MPFQPLHNGLYFNQTQIDHAKAQRDSHPHVQSAWQWLLAQSGTVLRHRKPIDRHDEPQPIIKPDLTATGQALEAAYRFRFLGDDAAGAQAISALQGGLGLRDGDTLFATLQEILAAAQIYEMLRAHLSGAADWPQHFAAFSDSLLSARETANYRDQVWLTALQIIAAIVLDDHARMDAGSAHFQAVIDNDIHPEGYLKPLANPDGDAAQIYHQMTQIVGALVLAAEAATQASLDLWAYTNRDVSINTAVTYLVFYYFYPDKWRWGSDLTLEATESIFRQDGAWLEFATYRAQPRGVEFLLEVQRPFFSVCGGLSTLTHIKPEKPRRRGLFG